MYTIIQIRYIISQNSHIYLTFIPEVQCPSLSARDNSTYNSSQCTDDELYYKDECIMSCDESFELKNQSFKHVTFKCGHDKLWYNDTEPECEGNYLIDMPFLIDKL